MGLKTNKTTKTSRLDCQYIESFPVSDGSRKLLTLSEKQSYIDERLKSYDIKKLGTAVCLEISPEGISMLQVGAKTVKMAHPLQRISYATAETSNKLFAYVSQPPGAADTEMVCHTFLTKKKDHAVEMSAALGKLLRRTSAYSLEDGDKLGEASQKRGAARQWAKKQVADGHRDLPKNAERKVKQQSFEVDEPRKENPSTLPEKSSVQNYPEDRNNNVKEPSLQPITSPQDSIAPSSPQASSLGSPSRTNHVNEASSQPITQVQSSSTEASAQSFPLETVYENVAPPLPPKAIKHCEMSKLPSFSEACNPTSPLPTDFPEPTTQPAQSYVPGSPEASSPSSPLGTNHMNYVPGMSSGPRSPEASSTSHPFRTDYMNEVSPSFSPQPTTQPAQSYVPSSPVTSNPYDPCLPPRPIKLPGMSSGPRFPEASSSTSPVRTGHANEVPSFYPQPTTQPAPPYGPRFPEASNPPYPAPSYGPRFPEASNPPYPVGTGHANQVPSFPPQPTTQPAPRYVPTSPQASSAPYPVRTGHANQVPSFPPQPTTQPAPPYVPTSPQASSAPYPVRTGHANQVPSFPPQPTTQPAPPYVPTSPQASSAPYAVRTGQANVIPSFPPQPTTQPPPPYGPRFPEASNPPFPVRTGYAPQPTTQPAWPYASTSPEARRPSYPSATNQMNVPPVLPKQMTLPPTPGVPTSQVVSSPFPPFGTNQMNVRPVLPKPTTLPPSSSAPTSPRKDNLLIRSESNPATMQFDHRMLPNHGASPNPVGNTTNPSEGHRLYRLNSAPSDMLFSSCRPPGNPRRSSDSFPQQVSPIRQVITAQGPGPRNENWYMPEASSDVVTNMLENMNFGSFVVRNSQSRPGCLVLTMKVSKGPNNQSGLAYHVIVPVRNGFVLEGFEKKVFNDISTLVQHHVSHKDGLFCRLDLTRPQSSLPQQQWQHGGARR